MSVQTSLNIELPPHLLLSSSMMEVGVCIGQGKATCAPGNPVTVADPEPN